MTRARGLQWALLGLLLCPQTLKAHDFWIEPSSFRPAPGDRVSIRLRVGENLQGDPVPRNPERIERFSSVAASAKAGGKAGEAPGEETLPGVPGADPAGWVTPSSPGLLWIVYDTNHASIELDAATFDKYLGEEGLESIREMRTRAGAKPGPVKEIYSRCAKALLSIPGPTSEGSGEGYGQALGLELELIPESNPYTLKPGSTLPVRLLHKGKPLSGALVMALSGAGPDARVAVRTDADGRAALRLERPGPWLVKAVHMLPAPADIAADWESLWASLTFELPER